MAYGYYHSFLAFGFGHSLLPLHHEAILRASPLPVPNQPCQGLFGLRGLFKSNQYENGRPEDHCDVGFLIQGWIITLFSCRLACEVRTKFA